jgi:hypothetical protein
MRLLFIITILSTAFVFTIQASENNVLAIPFDGKYGQLEIGGKYVGAEFHNSFPLPSRISFFYPVANSIDLSSDYWQRGLESHPFSLLLSIDGITEAIGSQPWKYEWTPFHAVFIREEPQYSSTLEYRFAEDLPVMIVRMRFVNNTTEPKEFRVFTGLSMSVRTSHTFALKDGGELLNADASAVVIGYPDRDTDSTAVFVVNAVDVPVHWWGYGIGTMHDDGVLVSQPRAMYDYKHVLAPGEEMEIIQIIGSCRIEEWEEIVGSALQRWEESVEVYENRILGYALDPVFVLHQEEHMHTLRWSRALLETNRHYIDGAYVPMPCPAEYNFYFTHDMLLTNLGTVMFDVDRVREDLLFLYSLTGEDDVLPHAYYWKDSGYVTEFAGSDNWNHLWFIILLNSYVHHSGDIATGSLLYPVADKSMRLILENYLDGLMYASRPDWWDIGNIYGARTYLTILTIRAIDSFASVTMLLDMDKSILPSYLEKSSRMKSELVHRLWDDDAGFLLNMLDETRVDRHYYAGSLLAAAFDLIDKEKMFILLATAREEMVDENLGLRIAMPPDFHELIDLYAFRGMEAGEAYQYLNGGVWPHGNAWYALGLIAAGLPDEAESVVRRYMTIHGIMDSPRGQPSFFEYRNADQASSRYGEIDKPTFLWAGGWYLHVMYRLAGVQDNVWNIAFHPDIPAIFSDIDYSIWIKGEPTKVSITGDGKYFRRIGYDGDVSHSAVLTRDVGNLTLERGVPAEPYLSDANCIVQNVRFDREKAALEVSFAAITGKNSTMSVVTPLPLIEANITGGIILEQVVTDDNGIYRVELTIGSDKSDSIVTFHFH